MLHELWQFLRAELAPQEGRLGMTWRTAAVCATVAMVFMVYGIPLAPIACYLVLFIMKPNITESLMMSAGIIVLVGLIMLPLLVLLAVISVDNVIVRMLVLAVGSFLFMYLSVASKVGEVGSIIALVIGFIMTLVGIAPFGELLTRAILYAGLMATAPMGVLLIFLLVLGPSPAQLAQRHLLRRWQAIAAVVDGEQPVRHLLPHLREGNVDIDKMLLFATLFFQLPKARLAQLKQLSQSSFQLMAAWVALPEDVAIPDAVRAAWSARCAAVVQALEQQTLLPADTGHSTAVALPPCLQDIALRLQSLPVLPAATLAESPLPKSGFFNDDIATNRSYAEFGLKVTFCAVICYLTYTALQWQDIHTAMITCYVAALGTVGETVHKLVLRISGCLVGAALGIASILFLMPHMTNIGQLMALVFAGCMVAAWVAQGSPRISYAGVQIGLAFVLSVLQGFGPNVSISVAMDRIYGILLGNFVMFIVFTQVWPLSASSQVLQVLRKHVDGFAKLLQKPNASLQLQAALPELIPQLQALREQAALSQFESAVRQDPVSDPVCMERSINELEAVYLKTAYGELSLQTPKVQELVHALQRKVMAGGVA